jgi:hypothetical protein
MLGERDNEDEKRKTVTEGMFGTRNRRKERAPGKHDGQWLRSIKKVPRRPNKDVDKNGDQHESRSSRSRSLKKKGTLSGKTVATLGLSVGRWGLLGPGSPFQLKESCQSRQKAWPALDGTGRRCNATFL